MDNGHSNRSIGDTTVDRVLKLLEQKKLYDNLFYGLVYDDYTIKEDVENRIYTFELSGFEGWSCGMDFYTKLDATIKFRKVMEDMFFTGEFKINKNNNNG